MLFMSVVGVVEENAAVGVENFGFGNEADVATVGIDNGEVPGAGVIKRLHYRLHVLSEHNLCGGRSHELVDIHAAVEVGAEHYVTDVVKQHDADKHSVIVDDREEISGRMGNDVTHLFEAHLRADFEEVSLNDRVHFKQGQHGFVLMMSQQFAALGQAHGVDAIGFEYFDCAIGYCADNQERQKEIIAARQLRGQEDAHQRSVHDSAHDSGHAHEGEVLCRKVEGEEIVDRVGKEEAGQTTDKERGGERAADTSAAVCCRSCECF